MNPQLPKKEVKRIILGDDATQAILSGTSQIYDAVSSTYGPAGMNVSLGLPFGDPTLTRDGVTVAKRVSDPLVGFTDNAESDAAAYLRQASEKTNKTAGDGTTATIVLGYNLVKHGHRLIAAGEKGMLLKKQIVEDSRKVIEFLQAESKAGKTHLQEVASVSAGDPAIGALISDTLKDIGDGGGISIREQSYPTLDVEMVNGYLFDRGFFALNSQVEYTNPIIFVTQKQMQSHADIVPLLDRVIKGDNKNLVIIGDVRMNSDAMNTLLLNIMQGKLNAVAIPPPAFNDEATLFMEDITTYVGSRLFTPQDDIKNLSDEYFGTAERVQVNQDRAIIFKGGGDSDAISTRAAEIHDEVDKETSAHRKDTLEQRYSKLVGKIAIVNVGGATQAEMEELRYRVEDSIEATKAAIVDGVLPGAGTMWVRCLELDISPLFKSALIDTFSKLMDNAAESPKYRLEQIKHAKAGYGFNLREMTDEPVDLTKAGIWDATRAITQTVENAVSAAGSILTIGAMIVPVNVPNKENIDG